MAHRDFMLRAVELAQKAYDMGEVPVGAVVVKDNKIIGEGYNFRETQQNALGHAEIMAIDAACITTPRLAFVRLYLRSSRSTFDPIVAAITMISLHPLRFFSRLRLCVRKQVISIVCSSSCGT